MNSLKGKTAVITGAASGMGAEHARRFIMAGAKVMLTDITVDDGQKLADELGENAAFEKLDVSKAQDWEAVISKTEELFGPVNVLVNNAGIGIFKTIDELTEKDFRLTMDINALSIFLSLKAAVPSMKKAGGGSIINISSIDGLRGEELSFAYGASKFAVNGMSKCAAIELAKYGIRVNTIHPGSIATPMAVECEDVISLEDIGKNIPLGRPGKPEEVSDLAIYIASDDSSYITGSEFVIDGGKICGINW